MENDQLIQGGEEATQRRRGKRKRKERIKGEEIEGERRKMIEETIRRYKERHPRVQRITDSTLDIIREEIKEENQAEVTMEELRAVNLWVRQRVNNRTYRRSVRKKVEEPREKATTMEVRGEIEKEEGEMATRGEGTTTEKGAAEGEKQLERTANLVKELEEEIEKWKNEAAEQERRRITLEEEATRRGEEEREIERIKKEGEEKEGMIVNGLKVNHL